MNSKFFNFLNLFNLYKDDLIQKYKSNFELFNSIKSNEDNKNNIKFNKINIVLFHNKKLNVDSNLKIKGNNKEYNIFPILYTHDFGMNIENFLKKMSIIIN